MGKKIQHKRGLKQDIPTLATSELGFTTDTEETYIGTNNKNIRLLDEKDKTQLDNRINSFTRSMNEITLNIKDYGAIGDGQFDNLTVFQEVFNLARNGNRIKVYIPDGNYVISNTLRMYSNTDIELSEKAKITFTKVSGVLFINGEFKNPDYSQGYSGDGNIRIAGGTIDLYNNVLPPSPSTSYGTQAIAFMHGSNIIIENVNIINGQNNHYIEINACKNVRITNNIFDQQIVTGTALYEVVQLDMAIQAGFPHFGSYDLTPCEDILIQGNTFSNCHSGVGTHTSSYNNMGVQVTHNNIRVYDNVFKNCKVQAIRAESWNNSKIKFNNINTTNSEGIIVIAARACDISDNTIAYTTSHGIFVNTKTSQVTDRPYQIKITNNRIKNIGRTAVRINESREVSIISNEVYDVGEYGIHTSYLTHGDIKLNILRGTSQKGNGLYNGIFIGTCDGLYISDNTINNLDYSNKYNYMVSLDSASSNNVVSFNKLSSGVLGNINNASSTSVISLTPHEKILTGILETKTGTITLSNNINEYRHLIIATGVVSNGDLRHAIARGYYNNGFRINQDFINVATSNGKFVAKVVAEDKIQIVSTPDDLRYIIGVL